MKGPFAMTQQVVHMQAPAEPGAYILGDQENKPLYVARADQNLRARLLEHFLPPGTSNVVPVSRFWFEPAPNAWQAYVLECTWYHQFSPTYNVGHPSRPLGGLIGCPICGR